MRQNRDQLNLFFIGKRHFFKIRNTIRKSIKQPSVKILKLRNDLHKRTGIKRAIRVVTRLSKKFNILCSAFYFALNRCAQLKRFANIAKNLNRCKSFFIHNCKGFIAPTPPLPNGEGCGRLKHGWKV